MSSGNFERVSLSSDEFQIIRIGPRQLAGKSIERWVHNSTCKFYSFSA